MLGLGLAWVYFLQLNAIYLSLLCPLSTYRLLRIRPPSAIAAGTAPALPASCHSLPLVWYRPISTKSGGKETIEQTLSAVVPVFQCLCTNTQQSCCACIYIYASLLFTTFLLLNLCNLSMCRCTSCCPMFIKFRVFFHYIKSTQHFTINPNLVLHRHCFDLKSGLISSSSITTLAPIKSQNDVAIFWDLDNKPPKSVPPYEAALKLIKSASSFGAVRYMIAYANRHAFSYVPGVVREQRRERKLLNQLENKGAIKAVEPYLCRVCGRKFYSNEKLMNHFQIHECEQQKRLNRIESARGKRRVNLVGKYAMKMEKYKNAARDVLTPKVGYGLADELKRAGFSVRTVSDKPQAADIALREHMVDLMDKRKAECLVLVSDDSDFLGVLKEAKLRCLKTVVVGDISNGALKRVADAAFSWQEVLMGKAKKEAVPVVGRWKDHDILKKLEWTYNPEEEKNLYGGVSELYSCGDNYDHYDESDNCELDGIVDKDNEVDLMEKLQVLGGS